MKRKAAFFDIDGTIYREGLITELFKKLITHELVDANSWHDEVRPAFMKWTSRQGDYDEYLDKMVEIYVPAITGLKKNHITHIAKKVIEQKGDRVYTFTRDKIVEHKKNNDLVIAISGSPIELVAEMANKYSFDDYKGTIYSVDKNNYYTGEIISMWDSPSKKKAIYEFVDRYNLDLNDCYAYGDTTGDFTMFKLVGHPYAINPTKSLLEMIKEDSEVSAKITIIVERKDMIYQIPLTSIDI
jgi:HAD superfamily hydrolase (TIGR01490 family)